MEVVNFSIDTDLNVESEKPFNFSFKGSKFSVYILGEVIGAIIDDTVYDDNDVLNYIKDNNDLDTIYKLIRNSIGSFYTIITDNHKANILCSYSSPGLLYTEKDKVIYFSNAEKDIFKSFGKLSNLNEEILLTTVTSHQLLLRPPFKTIFNNIARLPSATGIVFAKDLNIKLDFQLVNEMPENTYQPSLIKDGVNRFGFILENTMKLIVSYYDKNDKNLELSFSGGIDSSVLMVALKKTGLQFSSRHFAYSGTDNQEVVIAKRIAKKLNAKLFIQEKSAKPDIKYISNLSVSGLGTNVTPYQLTMDISSKAFGYDSTLNMINGQNADTLYHVDAFAPNSSTYIPVKILRTISKLNSRVMYSDLFLSKNKINWFLRLWPFSVKKKDLDFDLKEYLSSISIPISEHVIPLKEKIDQNDSKINSIIKKNKYKNIFLPIYDYIEANHKELLTSPSSLQKLSLIKIFRWYRTINNVPINYHNLQIGEDLNRVIPFTEGPIANFFLRRNLSFSEMFYIKKIFYKYFKKEVGKSYTYFCKNNSRFAFFLIFKALLDKASIFLSGKETHDRQRCYSEELNILKNIRLNDKKILLEHISDQEIKAYFESLYEMLDKSPSKISRNEMMNLCRLVNLENNLPL